MTLLRCATASVVLFFAVLSARADDVLFIGNSFTYADGAPVVMRNGGVPKLFEAIATAKGRQVSTTAVTAGGKGWDYHLAQEKTATALTLKNWTWVVLQDFSTRPTRTDNIPGFLRDGETFAQRIGEHSPHAGILLYETWARPAGPFYGHGLASPQEMMSDVHKSYAQLRDKLVAENPAREVRVALVGTAFARCRAEFPKIIVDAADQHHASAEGYYLAALVMYETVYHDTAKGAPTSFFNGEQIFPTDEAAELQQVADEVAARPEPD